MRITIRHKSFDITPALGVYIESKILKPIRRLLKNIAGTQLPVLDLEFSRVTRHHRKGLVYHAEANLSVGDMRLRAEIDCEDMRAACDLVEEELERQIVQLKGRRSALEKRGARRAKKELHLDPAARFFRKGRIREEGN